MLESRREIWAGDLGEEQAHRASGRHVGRWRDPRPWRWCKVMTADMM